MVKFNASILNRLKTMFFFLNTKYIDKYNVSLNKTYQTLHYFDKMFFFHIWTLQAMKCLASNKKKLVLTSLYYLSREIWWYGWVIKTYLNRTIRTHTRENSKIFHMAFKYFSFFSNTPPASLVAHIIRAYLTCYSMFQQSYSARAIKFFERYL